MKLPILMSLLFFLGGLPVKASDLITLCYGEWAPFQCPTLPGKGVTNYWVTQAFKQVNIDVKYEFLPWGRCEEMARKGEIDGDLVLLPTIERDQYFMYSDPVLQEDRFFFYRKDTQFTWENWDDLKGKKIGTSIGFVYGPEFDDAVARGVFIVEKVPRDKQNIAKVLKGWLDAVILNNLVAQKVLQNDFSPRERAKITVHPKAVSHMKLTILFSKKVTKNKMMRDRFNEGLKKLATRIGEERLLHPCDNLNDLDKENLTYEDRQVVRGSCR